MVWVKKTHPFQKHCKHFYNKEITKPKIRVAYMTYVFYLFSQRIVWSCIVRKYIIHKFFFFINFNRRKIISCLMKRRIFLLRMERVGLCVMRPSEFGGSPFLLLNRTYPDPEKAYVAFTGTHEIRRLLDCEQVGVDCGSRRRYKSR
jgi:hypothetical protein